MKAGCEGKTRRSVSTSCINENRYSLSNLSRVGEEIYQRLFTEFNRIRVTIGVIRRRIAQVGGRIGRRTGFKNLLTEVSTYVNDERVPSKIEEILSRVTRGTKEGAEEIRALSVAGNGINICLRREEGRGEIATRVLDIS